MATQKVDIVGTNGISAPQMSELFRLAGIPHSHCNGATLQRYLERRNPFEIKDVGYCLAPRVEESDSLRVSGVQLIPARNIPIRLAEFFKTRPGLCTTSTYDGSFTLKELGSLESLNAVGPLPERLYMAFSVKQLTLRKGLIENLPDDYLATLDDIAGLISTQMNGETGILFQNSCRHNYFFVAVDSEIRVIDITKNREDLYITAERPRAVYDTDCQILCPVSARFAYSLIVRELW